MTENQKSQLDEINELLEQVKDRLNKSWEEGTGFELQIIDQDNSPVRDFKEDIELKVRKLELSRK